jgi:hypothetical protein
MAWRSYIYHNWQAQPNGGWFGKDLLGGVAGKIVTGRNAGGGIEIFYLVPANGTTRSS